MLRGSAFINHRLHEIYTDCAERQCHFYPQITQITQIFCHKRHKITKRDFKNGKGRADRQCKFKKKKGKKEKGRDM